MRNDILKEFDAELRESRGQELTIVNPKRNTSNRQVKRNPQKEKKAKKDTKLDLFINKLDNLEDHVASFTNQDLLYYFMYCYEGSLNKSYRPNIKRDLASLMETMEYYSSEDICLMIEFMFNSDQNYLSKFSLKPTILKSGWCEKIYEDSNLWVNDKYFNKGDKPKNSPNSSKWETDKDQQEITIGEWS